ncbi:MAG: glycosyltransferase [Candidatus Korobacteraceae bacterium]
MTSTGCVLHVLDHSWPVLSGYSVRSRNLITAQRRLGQQILALTSPLHEIDDANSSDVVVDDVSYLRTPITGALASSALRRRWPVVREWKTVRLLRDRILQLIDSQPVSLVYAHSPALCGLAGLQAARKRGLPFVYEIRAFWEDAAVDQERTTSTSLRYRLIRGLETYVARRAEAVTAIAQPMLDDLRQRGVPAEKLFHVPNGVDADQFVPLAREKQLARKVGVEDSVVFGFFGSLYRYEGVAWLIRAASVLHSRGCRFKVLIIGSGEEEAAIRDAIDKHQAGHYVHTLPRVPHDEIRKYYSIVDVMVFPRLSVRLTELVTPLKPLEALSLEKSVLASDVGGHRALLEGEKTALLFRSGDVDDFCRQAERLIASPALRRQLGEEGRNVVLRDWDWKVVAQRYQRIYEFALQQKDHSESSYPSQRLELSAGSRRQS